MTMRKLVIALGALAAVVAISGAAEAQKKPSSHKVRHYSHMHKGHLSQGRARY